MRIRREPFALPAGDPARREVTPKTIEAVALDDVKDAFRNLVEPIGTALQALEQENSDNFGLRNTLAAARLCELRIRDRVVTRGRLRHAATAGDRHTVAVPIADVPAHLTAALTPA